LQSNKLGTSQLKRLKVYSGTTHPHTQELENVELKEIK
jgi:ribosomal protein L13